MTGAALNTLMWRSQEEGVQAGTGGTQAGREQEARGEPAGKVENRADTTEPVDPVGDRLAGGGELRVRGAEGDR